MLFFENIRACVSTDCLVTLVNIIKYQGTDKEIDYTIKPNTKVIAKAGMGKTFNTLKVNS